MLKTICKGPLAREEIFSKARRTLARRRSGSVEAGASWECGGECAVGARRTRAPGCFAGCGDDLW